MAENTNEQLDREIQSKRTLLKLFADGGSGQMLTMDDVRRTFEAKDAQITALEQKVREADREL